MKINKLFTLIGVFGLVLSLESCELSSENNSSEIIEEDIDTPEDASSENLIEDLEIFQNAISTLGSNPFCDWTSYKYVLTGDSNQERLLKTVNDDSLYGYSIEDETERFYLDGVCYSNYQNSLYEIESITTNLSSWLEKDTEFLVGDGQAIDCVLNLEANELTSLTISGDRYTLTYDREEDFGDSLGKYLYTTTYSFTISESKLVSFSSIIRETHTAGVLDTEEYTKTNSEYIKRVEPNDISYSNLLEAGYDYTMWETETEKNTRLVNQVLEAVSKISSISAKFGAVHVEEYEGMSNKNTTIYLTNDDSGNLYGYRKINYNSDSSSDTYYYYDGARYGLYTTSNGDQEKDVSTSNFGTLSSLIDNSYSDAIDNIVSIDDIIDDFVFNITSDGYELAFSNENAKITYTTTTDFDLIGLSYHESENHYYSVNKISSSDIDKQMSEFSKFYWDVEANNPAEMLEKIYYNCNYSLILKYDAWTTDMTMTYAEYKEDYANGQEKIKEMVNSLEVTTSYVLDFHYTEEALCYDEYILSEEGEYEYVFGTILINTESGCTQYLTYDNNEWEEGGSYSFSWQDSTYTLVDAYSYNVQNYFSYYGYATYNNEYCEAYRLTNSSAKNNYFLCLGNYHLWSSASTTALYYNHYFTYFFPQYEAMIANFYNEGWSYSGTLSEDTVMTYVDYEINAYVYNLCGTDISDYLSKIAI